MFAVAIASFIAAIAYTIIHGMHHQTAFNLSLVWAVLAVSIAPSPFGTTLGGLFAAARAGKPLRHSWLTNTLTLGVITLDVLGGVLWLHSGK